MQQVHFSKEEDAAQLPVLTASIRRAMVSLWLYMAVDFINHPLQQLKFSMLGPCTAPSVYLFLAKSCVGERLLKGE